MPRHSERGRGISLRRGAAGLQTNAPRGATRRLPASCGWLKHCLSKVEHFIPLSTIFKPECRNPTKVGTHRISVCLVRPLPHSMDRLCGPATVDSVDILTLDHHFSWLPTHRSATSRPHVRISACLAFPYQSPGRAGTCDNQSFDRTV
jgi:hypothetical protein